MVHTGTHRNTRFWLWLSEWHTVAAVLVMQRHNAAAHELAHGEELLQGRGSCLAGLARHLSLLTGAQLLSYYI